MKLLALHLLLVLCAIHAASGKAAGLPIDAFEQADLIAYVRVADDLDLLADMTPEKMRDPKVRESMSALFNEFMDGRAYRKIATATPLQVFKGPADLAAVKIRHTNSNGCPNVLYEKDKGYVVFLKKEADSDYYVTMCYYNGQFLVEDGKVSNFYLLRRIGNANPSYEQVAAFLRGGGAEGEGARGGGEGQPELASALRLMGHRLSPCQVQTVLDALCVELGFCLPPAAQARLRTAPPADEETFADEVISAEGLDPVGGISRELRRDVLRTVSRHFQRTEDDAEPANPPAGEKAAPETRE